MRKVKKISKNKKGEFKKMIFPIIFALIGFSIGVHIARKECWTNKLDISFLIEESLYLLVVGTSIGLIVYAIEAPIVGTKLNTEECVVETKQITALEDNSRIDGSSFLVCGNIEENLMYYYAVKDEKGITVKSTPAEGCYIRYADDDYRIEKIKCKFANKLSYLVAIPPDTEYMAIYVPKGSIINDYNVDLK